MTARITLQINSFAQGGFSETYWTNDSSVTSAKASALRIIGARAPLLGSEHVIFGYRTSIVGQPGVGSYDVTNPGNSGVPSIDDNDLLSTGLTYRMTNGSQSVYRLLKGIPDVWVDWNPAVQKMIVKPVAVAPFNLFSVALRLLGAGWPSAKKKGVAGTATQLISSIGIGGNGQLILTVPSTTGYGVINGSPVAIAGLKGLAGKLNGTYGPNAYSVTDATHLLFNVQCSLGQSLNYTANTGTVRLTNSGSNFISATVIDSNYVASSHKVGRGFGATRGRRSGKR